MLTQGDSSHGLPLVATSAHSLELVIKSPAHEGTVIACRRVVTLIGAREHCKVNIRHPSVAPLHAALIQDGDMVRVLDLLTPAGTKLNGLPIELETLSDGDELVVGPCSFSVRIRPSDDERTAVVPVDFEMAPETYALEHIESGKVLQPAREVCVIGRRSGCDIHVNDERVSRVHTLVFSLAGHPVLFDLLTPNQTLVNDEPVSFHRLRDQDVITVGASRFRVRLVVSRVIERAAKKSVVLARTASAQNGEKAPSDLIDIQAVEGSQRWRVADDMEKVNAKR